VPVADARRFKELSHSLSENDLHNRFDADRMTYLSIYPEEIWERDPDEPFDYLLQSFEVLWAFTRDVVDENQGYVVWIS
jgi:hypothetical protein